MITGNALLLWKQRALRLLDEYGGLEARESQLATNAQVSFGADARPGDVRQALAALAGDGLATRRLDALRGWLWKITKEGRAEAAKAALDDGAE